MKQSVFSQKQINATRMSKLEVSSSSGFTDDQDNNYLESQPPERNTVNERLNQ